jgi:hypothetical protein
VEEGYGDGVRAERERHLAIDRAGGQVAFEASELLASAPRNVREGR